MIVSANCATIPGREKQLKASIESIIDQVDVVRIYFNSHHWWNVPKWAKDHPKIICSIGANLADNAKFYWLKFLSEELYFVIDDDIIYPKEYVAYMTAQLKEHGGIITCHGRVLNPDGNWRCSYYHGSHFVHSFLDNVPNPVQCHVAGTGVSVFDTRNFRPFISEDKRQRMSDLIFSLEAAKQGVPITVAPHRQGWLKLMRTESSIAADDYKKDQSAHVEIVKEIMKIHRI